MQGFVNPENLVSFSLSDSFLHMLVFPGGLEELEYVYSVGAGVIRSEKAIVVFVNQRWALLVPDEVRITEVKENYQSLWGVWVSSYFKDECNKIEMIKLLKWKLKFTFV